jgi:pfkB family carbohydrate kinase
MSDFAGTVVGTGLLALDVVIGNANPLKAKSMAGGTCGNVLTALSFLGWHAMPIARIADDAAGDALRKDLARWRVDVRFLACAPQKPAPVIVERLFRDIRGNPEHKFSRMCPTCGGWLPGYQAVPEAAVVTVLESVNSADVFFFDRVSRGAVTAARHYARRGAVIFFEPSGIGVDSLFGEALDVSHVVKYSRDRLGEYFIERSMPSGALLQVETMGSSGLRYRSRLPRGSEHSWAEMSSLSPLRLVDTAGAGDWTSAGIINGLCRGGLAQFRELNTEKAVTAVRTGQALAAWTCGYEGPRGGMYAAERDEIYAEVESIRRGSHRHAIRHAEKEALDVLVGGLCAGCRDEPSIKQIASSRISTGRQR